MFGSRASRGSFMNNNAIIDVEDEEDEDVYEVDASLEQEMEREKEELVRIIPPHTPTPTSTVNHPLLMLSHISLPIV